MRVRKKPVEVEATRWFANGDHPKDNSNVTYANTQRETWTEGKVVRYYRSPTVDSKHECEHCNNIMHVHGWIDTLEGGHIVCPGDWIITGIEGEYYPCKPDIFEKTYDIVGG